MPPSRMASSSTRGAWGEGEPKKTIYEYEDIRGEPHAVAVRNINPYLVDAPDVLLEKRSAPICAVPEIRFGNQPIDGGHFILSEDERAELLEHEPDADKFIRPFLGADEFINNIPRYCLWLQEAKPDELRRLPLVMQRVQAVKAFRLESKRPATNDLAATPTQFAFVSHPNSHYLLLPSVSSERRNFIPIGFMPPEVIASNLCLIIPNATLYHFGILSSTMHNAWLRAVCGRMKSDYRYSAGIVYNNYPWPTLPSPQPSPASGRGRSAAEGEGKVEAAAQAVLDARTQFMLPSPASGRGRFAHRPLRPAHHAARAGQSPPGPRPRRGRLLPQGRLHQRCATGGVLVRALPATHQLVADRKETGKAENKT
jgi:hypothetical protein